MTTATVEDLRKHEKAGRAASTTKPEPGEPEPGSAEEEQAPEEVVVEGSEQQLTFAIGGAHVDESRITFNGGEFKVRGQFRKGERVRFVLEGVVDEIAIRDHRDRKTSTVTKTVRKHAVSVESVEKD